MKLIVDIDEQEYKDICENGYIYDEDNEYIAKVIANGTPPEDELDKLKEKINSEDVNCQYEDDYVYSSGLQKAIEVIDNRIEELKGE